MKYRHQTKAGNHGDLLKHWVLLEVLESLTSTDSLIEYLDSHAGAGSYPLDKEAQSRAVLKVLASDLAGLDRLNSAFQPSLKKGLYPGSPMLVSRAVPEGSELRLFELIPEVKNMLVNAMSDVPECQVVQGDGFEGVSEHSFKKTRQGLVLIDPPYEAQSDYSAALNCILNLQRKNPQATVMLWCPVFKRSQVNELVNNICAAGIPNVLYLEMLVKTDRAEGMSGSGMFVFNPPAGLEDQFQQVIPAVSAYLAEDNKARAQTVWITENNFRA